MKNDYVYGVPVFKFNRTILGDEVDVFISGGYHDVGEEGFPPAFISGSYDTIIEYYNAVEELDELKKKKRSWAI
jgi:hypothetical protein